MQQNDLADSDPRHLASVLAMDDAGDGIWTDDELGVVLRHQLSSVVQYDLNGLAPGAASRLTTLTSAQNLMLKSFSDLLHHPNPPIELLELTKEFAKTTRRHPHRPLPQAIATVLYYASIVVARIRCGKRITRLDDNALGFGVQWVLDQPWIDEQTKALFEEGQKALTHRKGSSE